MDSERELWQQAMAARQAWFVRPAPPPRARPSAGRTRAAEGCVQVVSDVLRQVMTQNLQVGTPPSLKGMYIVEPLDDLCGFTVSRVAISKGGVQTEEPQVMVVRLPEPLLSAHWESTPIGAVLPAGESTSSDVQGWGLRQARGCVVYTTVNDPSRGYLFLSENTAVSALLAVSSDDVVAQKVAP